MTFEIPISSIDARDRVRERELRGMENCFCHYAITGAFQFSFWRRSNFENAGIRMQSLMIWFAQPYYDAKNVISRAKVVYDRKYESIMFPSIYIFIFFFPLVPNLHHGGIHARQITSEVLQARRNGVVIGRHFCI